MPETVNVLVVLVKAMVPLLLAPSPQAMVAL